MLISALGALQSSPLEQDPAVLETEEQLVETRKILKAVCQTLETIGYTQMLEMFYLQQGVRATGTGAIGTPMIAAFQPAANTTDDAA